MSKPFEGLLGNNSELRMIEYLLPLKDVELSVNEMAKDIGISKIIVDRNVKKFVKWGVMNLTRTTEVISYYSINSESPIVKCIEQFNNALIENILGDEKLYDIHEYLEKNKNL